MVLTPKNRVLFTFVFLATNTKLKTAKQAKNNLTLLPFFQGDWEAKWWRESKEMG